MTAARREAPGTVEELAMLVREHAATRAALRVQGAGTWMDAGHPVQAAHTLDLTSFSGVREYAPADLTITVGAATTLATLDAATGIHGQWCPLLPWGDDRGSVGGTIATATAGPFVQALGRPRDLVLGLECVDGTGRIIRAGGRVVKNVAGFDLTRLMTGQWGTLGVITTLHLRLRARPAVDETVALTPFEGREQEVHAFVRGPLAPLACVPVIPGLDAPTGARWLLRLGGNAALVAESRARLGAMGTCESLPADVWERVRTLGAPGERASGWRWDALSARLKQRFDPSHILNPGLLGERA